MDYADRKIQGEPDRIAQVQVRRFEESDLEGVYETIQLTLETTVLAKVYEPEQLETWRDLYRPKCILGLSKLRRLYVAVYEGQIVGTAAVHRIDDEAYISCVFVNPHYQGLGIGKKLMDAVEKDEISQGLGKMVLCSSMTAGKFYEKFGFHSEGEFPDITVEHGVEWVHMVKELPPSR